MAELRSFVSNAKSGPLGAGHMQLSWGSEYGYATARTIGSKSAGSNHVVRFGFRPCGGTLASGGPRSLQKAANGGFRGGVVAVAKNSQFDPIGRVYASPISGHRDASASRFRAASRVLSRRHRFPWSLRLIFEFFWRFSAMA